MPSSDSGSEMLVANSIFNSNSDDESVCLLNDIIKWESSLDEISELVTPYLVTRPSISPPNWLLCHLIHVLDMSNNKHVLIIRMYASKRHMDLTMSKIASPPVVVDTWSFSDGHPHPSWTHLHTNEPVIETQPTSHIIPQITVLAFKESLNIAKRITILN
ncbi:hypothetical protein HD554DRAFT_2175100 [Boletus coccyginus]|nr:hypothetical protein HD554DRAFT_2175100 [Boletus coccyginus]